MTDHTPWAAQHDKDAEWATAIRALPLPDGDN